MNAPDKPRSRAAFAWDDPFLLDSQLSEDERMVRDAARAYCQDKLAPRVLEAFRNEKTDAGIFREMGALGLLGPTIPAQYGGPELNYVCYGLVAREVERIGTGCGDELAELFDAARLDCARALLQRLQFRVIVAHLTHSAFSLPRRTHRSLANRSRQATHNEAHTSQSAGAERMMNARLYIVADVR